MGKYIGLGMILYVMLSCNSLKDTNQEQDVVISNEIKGRSYSEMQMKEVDFCAIGNNPHWILEIDFNKQIKFLMVENKEEIIIPILKLGEETELPIVNYEVKGARGAELQISIKKNERTFDLSKQGKPYRVELSVKNKEDSAFIAYVGQGEYYGNLRLHDIWLLDTLNHKSINDYEFRKQPFINIQLDKGKLTGSLGCNSFASSIFFGRQKIFVHHIASTKMACLNDNVEKYFSKSIANKMFNYRFLDSRLILENTSDTLVFIKGD